MAIFKAIVNVKTGRAIGRTSPQRLENYLKWQTDDRGRVIKDEEGNPIPRDTIFSAINADEDNFALSCRETFAEFGVNQRFGSLQYRHYVQGFPPEDNDKMDRETCHRLGVEMAKTVWKDFPVLVVSHFDQENDGRYHWHNHFIVGNCNVHTGAKLNTSADSMWAQKRFVAAQAEANGLARRGLILEDGRILESQNIEPERITFGERQKMKTLQRKAGGLTPQQVREQNLITEKAELRLAIRAAAHATSSYEEFRQYLKDVYDVDTKETRGVISYLHPDRKDLGNGRGVGWIRGRALGDLYEKEAIENGNLKQVVRANRDDRGRTSGSPGSRPDNGGAGANRGIDEAHSGCRDREQQTLERMLEFYRELYGGIASRNGEEIDSDAVVDAEDRASAEMAERRDQMHQGNVGEQGTELPNDGERTSAERRGEGMGGVGGKQL